MLATQRARQNGSSLSRRLEGTRGLTARVCRIWQRPMPPFWRRWVWRTDWKRNFVMVPRASAGRFTPRSDIHYLLIRFVGICSRIRKSTSSGVRCAYPWSPAGMSVQTLALSVRWSWTFADESVYTFVRLIFRLLFWLLLRIERERYRTASAREPSCGLIVVQTNIAEPKPSRRTTLTPKWDDVKGDGASQSKGYSRSNSLPFIFAREDRRSGKQQFHHNFLCSRCSPSREKKKGSLVIQSSHSDERRRISGHRGTAPSADLLSHRRAHRDGARIATIPLLLDLTMRSGNHLRAA